MRKIYFFTITCLLISNAIMSQTYSGGAGTPEDPYQIANKADLRYLTEHISTSRSEHFIQTADIVFTAADFQEGGDFYNGGEGFIPIGNTTNYFVGSYNGQNYRIDNLFIYRSGEYYQGLFGDVRVSATISNLGLTNVHVTGFGYTGGLIGRITGSASVSNCYVTGIVTGGNRIGGLIGELSGYCSVTNCYANVSVNGTGGTGGLVGENYDSYNTTISDCYALGSVTAIGGGISVGGLVGFYWEGTISNCYARGAVVGEGSIDEFAGGLVGWANTNCDITNCYSTGTVAVNGTATDLHEQIGGLIGRGSYAGSDTWYSYWDTETSEITAPSYGIGKTTAEMKSVGTFIPNWGFSSDDPWAINGTDNDGYPFLRFQPYTPAHIFFGTSNSDWSTAANWSEGTLPDDVVVFVPNVTHNPVIASTNSITCTNLTIEGDAVLTLAADGSGASSLTVSGTLTNHTGNSGLVLESVETGTSSLIHNNADVAATVERYIAGYIGNDDGWHLLSSPVATFTIDGSSFDPGANDDLYSWEETTALWMNYKAGYPTSIEAGIGYLTAWKITATKSFTGTLNEADIPLSNLSYTPSAAYPGWHLLGNPFPCALQWDPSSESGWDYTNVGGIAKILNNGASYSDIGVDGYIPSAQGFMVYVSSATNTLTIPTANRVHNSTNWYKNEETNKIKLTAYDPEGSKFQETIIQFNADASDAFDLKYDSYFMSGYAPYFYSSADGKALSTNTLPELKEELTIPLYFIKNSSSMFYIEAEGLNNLIPSFPVYLTDLQTNYTQNLTNNPVYSFTSEEGDVSQRFLLHFKAVGTEDPPVPTRNIQVWSAHNTVYILNPENQKGEIEVLNLFGQKVAHESLTGDITQEFQINVPAAYYLVSIISKNSITNRKVFLGISKN